MLKLGALPSGWLGAIVSTDPEDPRPFLLPGVRVRFEPIGRKAVRAAREACGLSLQEHGADWQEALDALSCTFMRRGIVEWEGIGDAEGNALAVTPESVELFIANADTFEAAHLHYVSPWIDRDREKNVSAASSNGTSAVAMAAADIVTSPATQEAGGDAPSVPTSSTKPRRKKANSSSK
jgi:hypothetical protein